MSKTSRIITTALLTIATIGLVVLGIKLDKNPKNTFKTYAESNEKTEINQEQRTELDTNTRVDINQETELQNTRATYTNVLYNLGQTVNTNYKQNPWINLITTNTYNINIQYIEIQENNSSRYTFRIKGHFALQQISTNTNYLFGSNSFWSFIELNETHSYATSSVTFNPRKLIELYINKIEVNKNSTETNSGTATFTLTALIDNEPYNFYFTKNVYMFNAAGQQTTDNTTFNNFAYTLTEDNHKTILTNYYTTIYTNAYAEGYNDGELLANPIALQPLMLNILTMPFTFISQAFDVTLWPNTAYEFNIANFIKGIIAIATILFIIRLFTSGFSIIGNYNGNAQDRKLTKSQIELNKAKTNLANRTDPNKKTHINRKG